MVRKSVLLAVLGLLMLLAVGCPSTANELGYGNILYETGVPAGESISGTGLEYVGLADGRAQVLIKGQQATKQKGDSLAWKGSVRSDVNLELALRVLGYTEETLRVAGTAKITVHNPNPVEAEIPDDAPLHFANAPVVYTVERGNYIPGTTLEYQERSEEGAKLGGVDGYPYFKTGDSVVWEGQIHDGVYLQLNMRVGVITEGTLTLAGTANLWIVP
jgi:hypothetical protein